MRPVSNLLIIMLSLLAFACGGESPKATLVITHARIWTADAARPYSEAMAIMGDTICAIGEAEEMRPFVGEHTQVVDLGGHFVAPGFIDCHVHLISGGRSLLSVDLRDAASPEEFIRRIADYAQQLPPGSWIMEGNWDHSLWGGELPHKSWIDAYTPQHPVAVFRLDGHMLLANSLALQLAGIDAHTPEPAGGEIVRQADGRPTGILKDNAMNLLLQHVPPLSAQQKAEAFEAAMQYLWANGVTSVHDVDGLNGELSSYETARTFQQQGRLGLRLYAAKPLSQWEELAGAGLKNDKWVKTGCLKGFVDGSLGSHTAAFKQPYTDQPNDYGLFLHEEAELYRWIASADSAGLHLLVHAIGDSAIACLLNIYQRVAAENGPRDRRFRMEHAQHIDPADMHRFAQLGVIASMQPYHAIDDGRWAETYIGPERIRTTYAFRSLLDAGATLAFGSDWAVAPASPIQGIYAAVSRRTLDGRHPGGWVPGQKISVEEALLAYTRHAAYASFEEDLKGSLQTGKLADFVVLSQDPFRTQPAALGDIRVLQTYVGGVLRFGESRLGE